VASIAYIKSRAIGPAVAWLLSTILPDSGAFPRDTTNREPDLVGTVLALEAIRRSDQADEIAHVLEAGETWLVAG